MTESQLLYEVMRKLGKHGAVFRTNSGNIKLPNGKIFHGLPKGHADIVFYKPPNGAAYFIECKVKPNKATPEQLAFIEKMQKIGCYAGVAYSVDEALQICGYE